MNEDNDGRFPDNSPVLPQTWTPTSLARVRAPISQLIAGWPALALLLAVKLLYGMLNFLDTTSGPGSEAEFTKKRLNPLCLPPGWDRPGQINQAHRHHAPMPRPQRFGHA